jgi:hypothetical protein
LFTGLDGGKVNVISKLSELRRMVLRFCQAGCGRSASPRIANRLALCSLLGVFFIIFGRLARASLWYDEARSLWVVQAPSSIETLVRLGHDVHPPLYFLMLDVWVALVGESAYAARMLSAVLAVLALSATYVLGKRLFDCWTALLAVVLLGTMALFITYAQEARMYSLLLCLGVLSMWGCLSWLYHPTGKHLVLYSLTIAALLYTHVYAFFLVFTQGLWVLFSRPRRWGSWLLVLAVALAVFALWTPGLIQQARYHFDGALDPASPTSWWLITYLVAVMTGGWWWLSLLPFLLGRALCLLQRYGESVSFLLLWFLVTPLAALVLNLWLPLFYHVRYLVAILPACALLVAYGLRHVCWWPLQVILLACLIAVQCASRDQFWSSNPPWEPAVQRMVAERKTGEPSLTYIAPCCVEAYYDRQLGIRDEASLDLSARRHSAAEVQAIVASLQSSPSVWLIMPTNVVETWEATWALDADRHVGYRDGVELMRFYRFDLGEGDALSFRFGSLLRYNGAVVDKVSARPGERVCADVDLTALTAVDEAYSMGLHLVDAGNRLRAQHDVGIGALEPGERTRISRCLLLPTDVEPGDYGLHLVVYRWATLERLPVLEGCEDTVSWGDALVFTSLSVAE